MSVEMESLVVELLTKCYYGRVLRANVTPAQIVRRSRLRRRRRWRNVIRRYEIRSPQTARAVHHHRFAGRHPDHPADLFCRLDDV